MNGKLNLYLAATSVRRPRPSFHRPNESSPIVITSVKQPSSILYTQFGFILSL